MEDGGEILIIISVVLLVHMIAKRRYGIENSSS